MKTGFYRSFGKRAFDLVFALLVLAIAMPLLALLWVLLRLNIGAPVVFRQTRPGFKGRPFTLFKFRTMTDQRDGKGNLLPDEQRITKVGNQIRKASLDELPEIINVLRGDMSFVGPRPLMMQYLERYTPTQARRHEVLPGITGWVQVNGRNALPWDEKFDLDVWYVDHQSFLLDVRILAITCWKVVRREGINHDGFVAAPEFMGSEKQTDSTDLLN